MNQSFLTLMGLALVIPATMLSPDVTLATPNQLTFQSDPDQKLPTNSFDTLISQQNPPSRNPPDHSNGSRDPICAISPGVQEQGKTIWSDRPLFLWQTQQQGLVGRIALRRLGTPEVLWNQTIPDSTQHIAYTGSALEPGQYYQWILSSGTATSGVIDWNTARLFKVMAASQRDPITAALQQIEAQLSARQASVEAIALQKAEYLEEQGLWSDALQTLYSVANPSAAVTQAIQAISSSFCPSAE